MSPASARAARHGVPPRGRAQQRGGQEVEAVGLGEVAICARSDAEVSVLPDDPLRARVDHDDAMVPVVRHGDHPVRPAHRERRAVELPGAGGRRVCPDDTAARRQLVDASRRVEACDEDVPVREQLRVGRVRRRRAQRVHEPPACVDPVDPTADLRHEHTPVGERRRPVRRAEASGRAVSAGPRVPDLVHHPMRAVDEEDATVLDVRDHEEPVLQEVGVVRVGQKAGGGAARAGMTVRPDDPVGADVDLAERLVVLLVRRDRAVAGREERVVGIVEALPWSNIARSRKAPDDPLLR